MMYRKLWIALIVALSAVVGIVGFASAEAEDFLYTAMEDGIHITQYTGRQSTVIIPAEIEGIPVVSV